MPRISSITPGAVSNCHHCGEWWPESERGKPVVRCLSARDPDQCCPSGGEPVRPEWARTHPRIDPKATQMRGPARARPSGRGENPFRWKRGSSDEGAELYVIETNPCVRSIGQWDLLGASETGVDRPAALAPGRATPARSRRADVSCSSTSLRQVAGRSQAVHGIWSSASSFLATTQPSSVHPPARGSSPVQHSARPYRSILGGGRIRDVSKCLARRLDLLLRSSSIPDATARAQS